MGGKYSTSFSLENARTTSRAKSKGRAVVTVASSSMLSDRIQIIEDIPSIPWLHTSYLPRRVDTRA